MADGTLEMVMLRNNFYRDNFHRCIFVLIVSIVVNLVSIFGMYYAFSHQPSPKYFATNPQGRIMRLYPLSVPMVSNSYILSWANQAAVAAYTYNFVNYRGQLQKASDYFTPQGWKGFEQALASSRNLQTVIARKLVATAVATGSPVIEDQRVIAGRYSWRISLPVLIKYESASTRYKQSLVLRMIVVRVPTVDNPSGIAIQQFIAGVSANPQT